MIKYTFDISGGSPFNGEIVVLATNSIAAKNLVGEALSRENASRNTSEILKLTGDVFSELCELPCVVSFITGDS